MISLEHNGYILYPVFGTYSNGLAALQLVDADEPYATITVNLPDDVEFLAEGEHFIKDWSENSSIVKALVEQGWLEPTGKEIPTGYVSAKIMRFAGPLIKLYLESIE